MSKRISSIELNRASDLQDGKAAWHLSIRIEGAADRVGVAILVNPGEPGYDEDTRPVLPAPYDQLYVGMVIEDDDTPVSKLFFP
jgi:hypothetical protein